MRPRLGTNLLAAVIVVVFLAVSLNAFLLHRLRLQYAPFSTVRAQWYNVAGQLHEEFDYIRHWQELADQVQGLKDQLQQARVTQASLQSLQTENDFLRKSLGLKSSLNRAVIPAGIFNISLDPTGYSALINKGSQDRVAPGAFVVSANGVLVGKIETVFADSARVQLISDPAFSITVKVMGGGASGIARGALANGMSLDLIVQTDQLSEGDTLVSTGNDMAPVGLIVGTVANVKANDTQLFKKVTVKPAADLSDGNVLVVLP